MARADLAVEAPGRRESSHLVAPCRLVVSCDDRPGIVAAVSGFLYERGANIIASHQYSTGAGGGRFFLRTEFHLSDLDDRLDQLEVDFVDQVARHFAMTHRLWPTALPKRIAILVSRYDHCLVDLLWRSRRGELGAHIDLVISNHPDLRDVVDGFGVEYVHVPVDPQDKPAAEARMLEHLSDRFDLVVLARYMQILSERFLAEVGAPVINIHHSFLPAFAGADPYQRAHHRGVKMVGATAHYVTPELDAGPIIEQDIARVDHADDVESLVRIGRDVERMVLARAVGWHLEDRVLLDSDRTVVFA